MPPQKQDLRAKERNFIIYLLFALCIWNGITFGVYATDKYKATHRKRRISEKTLLLCAFFMGGIGAFLGMHLLKHKTKHIKFNILVPLSLFTNAGVVALFYYLARDWIAVW